jgi:hypothetical protein
MRKLSTEFKRANKSTKDELTEKFITLETHLEDEMKNV